MKRCQTSLVIRKCELKPRETPPVGLKLKTLKIPCIGKDVKQWNSRILLVGMQSGRITWEINLAVSSEVKHTFNI